MVLALIYGVAAIPLHALVVRRRAPAGHRSATTEERAEIVKAATRRRPFWLLVIAFTANGGAVAVMAVLLITYLIHLGHSPVLAATLAGLLGVLSVTGRLVTTGLQRRMPAALIAATIFALQGVAVLLLPAGRADGAGRDRLRAAVRARIRHRLHHPAASAGRAVRHRSLCLVCRAASPSSPSPTRPWPRWERSRSRRRPATAGSWQRWPCACVVAAVALLAYHRL